MDARQRPADRRAVPMSAWPSRSCCFHSGWCGARQVAHHQHAERRMLAQHRAARSRAPPRWRPASSAPRSGCARSARASRPRRAAWPARAWRRPARAAVSMRQMSDDTPPVSGRAGQRLRRRRGRARAGPARTRGGTRRRVGRCSRDRAHGAISVGLGLDQLDQRMQRLVDRRRRCRARRRAARRSRSGDRSRSACRAPCPARSTTAAPASRAAICSIAAIDCVAAAVDAHRPRHRTRPRAPPHAATRGSPAARPVRRRRLRQPRDRVVGAVDHQLGPQLADHVGRDAHRHSGRREQLGPPSQARWRRAASCAAAASSAPITRSPRPWCLTTPGSGIAVAT